MISVLLLPLLLFSLALSCSVPRPLVVAMDEAFTAARPGLTSELFRLRVPGFSTEPLALGLGESPARALELTEGRGDGKPPAALIASSAIARALGPRLGSMPLIAPDWEGEPVAGIIPLRTDPLPAYRDAGRAAGAYIAAIRARSGGNPSCGVLYSSSPLRPRGALEAFAEAFNASYGSALGSFAGAAFGAPPLLVRELPPSPTGDSGESEAKAAVGELLGSDLRLLFVATGGSTLAALQAASTPDLVLGADFGIDLPPDFGGARTLPALSFVILPDDRGMARAVRDYLETWRRKPGRGAAGPGSEGVPGLLVPALLMAGPAASRSPGGSPAFGAFLPGG